MNTLNIPLRNSIELEDEHSLNTLFINQENGTTIQAEINDRNTNNETKINSGELEESINKSDRNVLNEYRYKTWLRWIVVSFLAIVGMSKY